MLSNRHPGGRHQGSGNHTVGISLSTTTGGATPGIAAWGTGGGIATALAAALLASVSTGHSAKDWSEGIVRPDDNSTAVAATTASAGKQPEGATGFGLIERERGQGQAETKVQ